MEVAGCERTPSCEWNHGMWKRKGPLCHVCAAALDYTPESKHLPSSGIPLSRSSEVGPETVHAEEHLPTQGSVCGCSAHHLRESDFYGNRSFGRHLPLNRRIFMMSSGPQRQIFCVSVIVCALLTGLQQVKCELEKETFSKLLFWFFFVKSGIFYVLNRVTLKEQGIRNVISSCIKPKFQSTELC